MKSCAREDDQLSIIGTSVTSSAVANSASGGDNSSIRYIDSQSQSSASPVVGGEKGLDTKATGADSSQQGRNGD